MNILERVFSHDALVSSPPVLVDVGASGGVQKAWRAIAPYSIGIGVEPDARERGALGLAHRSFKRWIFCDKIIVAEEGLDEVTLHLTSSPFCSSTLKPDMAALQGWAFADLFAVQGSRVMSATTLTRILAENSLGRVDWLKCDTQGTDLRIWRSLPDDIRRRSLALEFEPGLIPAYIGEDKFCDLLVAMESEPFWLARLDVLGTPRGRMETLTRRLGRFARYYRDFGPASAGWVNALYLHSGAGLGLRESLLLWVFATEHGQHLFACELAETAASTHNDKLCAELADRSANKMKRVLGSMWKRAPEHLWRKLFRS